MLSFSKRAMGAVLLAVPVAVALGVLRAHLGCGGATPRRGVENADAGVVDGGVVGEGGSDAGGDGGDVACAAPIVINVEISGSYISDGPIHTRPSLITPRYVFPTDDPPHPTPRCRIAFDLAEPAFASAFSITDLCSTEEASPSYLRIDCLGPAAQRKTIEYRLENHRILTIHENGRAYDFEARGGERSWITQIPVGNCAVLTTHIPKRELSVLETAYLNDTPSERCRTSTDPKRKVPAKFAQVPIPNGHDLFDLGTLRCGKGSSSGCCRDYAFIAIVLPNDIAPAQNLGILGGQCNPQLCFAQRGHDPNGASIGCMDSGDVLVYQLGDGLFIVERDGVRKLPLPCNVELDFQLDDVVSHIGISGERFHK